MSILGFVQVGATAARAALDAAAALPNDGEAVLARLGLLEYLRTYASHIEVEGHDAELIAAYRDWLEVAVELYTNGDQGLIPTYMRRAGLLNAEVELAEARASGQLGPASFPATNG